jgi:hypothetical protein
MTSPTWCNCSLDVAGRWCRVCRPGVEPSGKRELMVRMKRRRKKAADTIADGRERSGSEGG